MTNHIEDSLHKVKKYCAKDASWTTVGHLLVAAFRGFGVVGVGGLMCVEGGGETMHEVGSKWQYVGLVNRGLIHGVTKQVTPYVHIFDPTSDVSGSLKLGVPPSRGALFRKCGLRTLTRL